MITTRYFKLLPLLVLLGACQPEPAEPEPGEMSSQEADAMKDAQEAAANTKRSAPKRVAEVQLAATEGNRAGGTVRFLPENSTVRVEGKITGLEPGAHGLHIHANGDCSAPDASSAGSHFSPSVDDPHGSPHALPHQHHVGDLGNVTAGADGTAEVMVESPELKLSGPDSIIGKALIVHAGRDDFKSQPSGDSGARVGCGVIREAAQSAGAAGADTNDTMPPDKDSTR